MTDVGKLSEAIQESLEALEIAVAGEHNELLAHAIFIRDTLLPEMLVARGISDALEQVVPDDIWPLPSYTEMLFIR